jgi:flagellar FliJ protein
VKRFKFRYQALLNMRAQRESQEQQKLSELVVAVQHIDAEIERLQAEANAHRERWHATQASERLDIEQLMTTEAYLVGLARRVETQQQSRVAAQKRVEKQRDVLLAARREREIMTRLEERDRAQWVAALAHAENALLDELGTMRHTRRD